MRNSKLIVAATVAIGAIIGMGAASAADLAARSYTKAAPMMVDPAYDWSGFYIGGQAGYAWGKENWIWTPTFGPLAAGTKPAGFLGGVHGGYQYQWNHLVLGVELAWDGGDVKDTTVTPPFAGGPRVFDAKIDSTFTAVGRLGFAQNNWLFYGKGGYASAEVTQSVTFQPAGTLNTYNKERFNGWVAGGGVEYAFASNWIAGIEYNYVKLDVKDRLLANGVTPNAATFTGADTSYSYLTARLSYKFGGPVAGKY
jgi:outer membrane immunogenic protein